MSRDWQLRVEDILAAAERATRFVGQMDLAAFKADERTAAAVLHQIFLIGEAAARLPEEIRSRAPDIPWEEIIGMRNIIAHGFRGGPRGAMEDGAPRSPAVATADA
jgi:uncharacterized protein with HEPN domain